MKKLLYITNSLGAYSETFITNTIQSLENSAYVDLILATTKARSTLMKNDINLSTPKLYQYLINVLAKIKLKSLADILKYSYINGRLKNVDFDVAWIDFGDNGINLYSIFNKRNKKVIVHLHGYDASKLLFKSSYLDELISLSKKNIIIVPSHYNRKRLIISGCNENNICVMPYAYYGNFKSYDENKIQPEKPILLFAGRFVPKKDPRILLYAFREVIKTNDNVQLIMIGDGKLFNEVRTLIKEFKLEHRVKTLGSLPQIEVLNWMQKATIYIQHSVTSEDGDQEGYPNSILEAQCSGLPVVSTIHAGIPEIVIDGETGYLVQEHDYEKMAERISHLLREPYLINTMGKNASARFRHSAAPENRINNLLQIINQ